jgi:hypothetical protein
MSLDSIIALNKIDAGNHKSGPDANRNIFVNRNTKEKFDRPSRDSSENVSRGSSLSPRVNSRMSARQITKNLISIKFWLDDWPWRSRHKRAYGYHKVRHHPRLFLSFRLQNPAVEMATSACSPHDDSRVDNFLEPTFRSNSTVLGISEIVCFYRQCTLDFSALAS